MTDSPQMAQNALCELLPDRRYSTLPPQVQYVLSVCEAATIWTEHQIDHHDSPAAWFCEGVVDYWWDDDLVEPTFEQLFRRNLSDGSLSGFPTHERFCYQQGAIVGYRLRERFRTQMLEK